MRALIRAKEGETRIRRRKLGRRGVRVEEKKEEGRRGRKEKERNERVAEKRRRE